MNVYVQDHQVVGETPDTLFTLVQAAPEALITLQNTGTNTINYRFQEFDGSTWTDMDVEGTDLYNTLTAGQVRMIKVESSNTKVKLVGHASGASTLDFTVTRLFDRPSGGSLPMLTY